MKATAIKHYLWIGGRRVPGGGAPIPVVNPYDGQVMAEVTGASQEDVDAALANAAQTFRATLKGMAAHRRAEILYRTSQLLAAYQEELARIIVGEAGKPIKLARAEVGRAIQVFRFAAEEADTLEGSMVPMDASPSGEGRWGMVLRVPRGVVAGITPFNFPLNLVAHKVAPALAAGNAIVLKPASKTPLSALRLAELLQEAGLPDGAYNVVVGSGSTVGESLARDPRVAMVTFTGSRQVGQRLTEIAGIKPLTLELGANSPNIVCADADLGTAARALASASFAYAGQSCISSQRIYVQRPTWEEFLDAFQTETEALKVGDPEDESTDIGPMISEADLDRIESWLQEAQANGARVLTGGRREGRLFYPTVVVDVNPSMRIVCEETFAPIVSVVPFSTLEEAARQANDSVYGLQAGVFTRDLDSALYLARELEMGGVWVNDASVYRQDNYPYGGVKGSGLGREGVKYAVEEMTALKFVGIKSTAPNQ